MKLLVQNPPICDIELSGKLLLYLKVKPLVLYNAGQIVGVSVGHKSPGIRAGIHTT